MAGNVLKAVITADDGQFAKTLADLQAQLKRFEAQLKNTGNVESFNRIQRAAEATKQKIQSLNNVPAGAGLKAVKGGADEATRSLIDLGRVVQDAPFGFIGIANNLNPLFDGLGRTAKAAGGFGGAMKSLGSSLLGAGGISLAISLASSALVLFGDELFGTGKKAQAAEESINSVSESLAKDITKLAAITGLVRNNNAAMKERQQALAAFNQEYKGYLKDLGIEEVGLNNISKAYDEIINKMIRQAVVKGLQEEISAAVAETAKEIVKLQVAQERNRIEAQKSANAVKQELSAEQKRQQAIANAVRQRDAYTGATKDGFIAQTQFNIAQQEGLNQNTIYDRRVSELTAKLKEQLQPLYNLTTNFEDLGVTLSDLGKDADKFDFGVLFKPRFNLKDFEDPLKILRETVTRIGNEGEIVVKPKIKLSLFASLSQSQEENDREAEKTYDELKKRTEDRLVAAFERNPIIVKVKAQIKLTSEIEKKFQEDLKSLNDIAQRGITDLAAGFVEGIGNLLSGKDFGSEIFGIIGGVLTNIGKAIIAIGVVKVNLEKVLTSFLKLPAAAIFAIGAASLAIGTIVKNIQPRAKGGPVSGNSPYLVGEKGPELFVPATGGQIINNAALMNAGRSFSGGGQVVRVIGEFVQRGTDLVAVITQTNNSQSRLG